MQTTFNKDCGILFLYSSVSYSLSTVLMCIWLLLLSQLYSFSFLLPVFHLWDGIACPPRETAARKLESATCAKSLRKVCQHTLMHTLLVFSEHDECVHGLNTCDENSLCFNTVGGHSCSCKPGYVGNGTVCRGKRKHLNSTLHISLGTNITVKIYSYLCK